ncbi:leucine-rich_repeat domain-containing protein [Hexamita inflata]|uniref:Leucine-rich repeat domain-containing protein n=1 Tax=Hexamita inflata TaxID=28002 RepID=A0AA86RP03_9EUKA|nr:leucine-rich repeat domain-containing protein [Hexamita inflata]
MTEQLNQNNQIILNQEYNEYMIRKYDEKIEEGDLKIGNQNRGDPEVKNLRFIEKLNIRTLTLFTDNVMSLKLRSNTIKELSFVKPLKLVLNLNVNDLELENLEILRLFRNGFKIRNKLQNSQLFNLSKFNKLHTLDVSFNNVDLTHIHSVLSLTKLSMQSCGLKSIDQIESLTNLEYLNISNNLLQSTDSVSLLVNLKELYINNNENIDITPLNNLVGLINLGLSRCGLKQLNTLKSLINLQFLDISDNSNINITELQYLKNLTHLEMNDCDLVSIYVLRPLMKLKELSILRNKIVYLDANINEMKQLEELIAEDNRISDFSSLEKRYNNQELQDTPSQEELRDANTMRYIESPNIQLKQIQNKRKILKMAFNDFKQKINASINNAHQIHTMFTVNVVHLFQQNQFD